jgi:hypothetical protein
MKSQTPTLLDLSLMDFKEARIEGTIRHYQHGHFLLSIG